MLRIGEERERALWGAKTRCALREISDLQAERSFWHPTIYRQNAHFGTPQAY